MALTKSSSMLAAVALAAALATARAGRVPDPFPSLESVGDTKYTSVSQVVINVTNGNAAAQAASDASHAVTNAATAAKSTLGPDLMNAWLTIDAKEYAALNATGNTCDPSSRSSEPLSFAFQGSGLLLPYYAGVVDALQQRGVITPQVAASAKFGGLSGGSIVSALTALGFSGQEVKLAWYDIQQAINTCLQTTPANCGLSTSGFASLKAKILAKIPTEREVLDKLNGRLQIWSCQLNAMQSTMANSVSMGTSQWSSLDDLLNDFLTSTFIPCFTEPKFYATFRGAPYIDGGYCNDYAQLCPLAPAKCLKVSTSFLGPNLPGPIPTHDTCAAVVPPTRLPNVGKAYYTPADPATWTLPSGVGQCPLPGQPPSPALDAFGFSSVPFVPQGISSKPDIHPAFYAPLPSVFANGCAWLSSALDTQTLTLAKLEAMFEHGVASGLGWANQNGYCA